MGLFIGMQFVFVLEVSVRVRYEAPQVRNLRKIMVNLYRRMPLLHHVYIRSICVRVVYLVYR